MKSDKIFAEFRQEIEQSPDEYVEDYFRLKSIVDRSSAVYEDEPVSFLYQPVFYRDEEIDLLKEVAGTLTDIFKKVIEEYRNSKQFRQYFNFSSLLEELILVEPGYEIDFPMARFDIFYGPRTCKFCEINTDGTSGMNESRVIQNCFESSKIMNCLAADYEYYTHELFFSWIEALKENYRKFCENNDEDQAEEPVLVIMDFEGEGVIKEFEEFKKRFRGIDYQVFICDPRELEYREQELYYNEHKVDIIYRRATTGRLLENAEQIDDLLTAYKEKAVCMVGGFVSQLIHNKKIFALLHDSDRVSFLDKKEQKFIKKHVPATEVLDHEDQKQKKKILNLKDSFILKPCDSFACKGVYAGVDYEQGEWEKILADIKDKNYIVQEFVSLPARDMLTVKDDDWCFEKYNILTGIYLYNYQFSGIYNRGGRKNIIGSPVESFTLPAFVMSEKEN